jgi:hypothetical protein
MADLEKIAQIALPALAGVASAFDPYRNVSRGLNQAVTMRASLKGQAERSAYREAAQERAEADQKMQEQRQQWAETNFGRQQEQFDRLDQDRAAFEEYRGYFRGNVPQEFQPRVDAARTTADLKGIETEIKNLETGTQMASALQRLDPTGQYVSPEILEVVKRNPSWGTSILSGLTSMQQRRGQETQEFQKVSNELWRQYEAGQIDALDLQDKLNTLRVKAPGQIDTGRDVTREEVASAVKERQKQELEANGVFDRAKFLLDYAHQKAGDIFSTWELVQEGQDPWESKEIQRLALQEELNKSYEPYAKLAGQLIAYDYEPFPRYTLDPAPRLNPETEGTANPGGAHPDYAVPAGKAAAKEQPMKAEVQVSGQGFPSGLDSAAFANMASEIERKFVPELRNE